MKNVTLLAVKHAALLLIEANKTTSTLEVKELLRSLDYFAEQDEVSSFLDAAAQELPLSFTTTPGHFRVYTLPSIVSLYSDTDDDDTSVTTQTTTVVARNVMSVLSADALNIPIDLFEAADHSYTSRKDEVVLLFSNPLTIKNNGGTVYRMSTGANRAFYFAQPIRRDLARSAHASTLGIDYNDTRSNAVVL